MNSFEQDVRVLCIMGRECRWGCIGALFGLVAKGGKQVDACVREGAVNNSKWWFRSTERMNGEEVNELVVSE